MPRKTKKKKVIADYRKKLSKLSTQATLQLPIDSSVGSQVVLAPRKEKKITSVSPKQKAQTLRPVDYAVLNRQKLLIARDIRKTMILSVLAIGSLIVISLVPIH